jgi:protein subunit release factor B
VGFDSSTFRMTNVELAFSISISDCEVQTFRSGGKGGQNQNKRDTGVRVIHHESGARGEARDERSQLQNKKLAFKRMVDSKEFQLYIKKRVGRDDLLRAEVERSMTDPRNILMEVKDENGKWVAK